jgi:hypothetical protein
VGFIGPSESRRPSRFSKQRACSALAAGRRGAVGLVPPAVLRGGAVHEPPDRTSW